MDECGTILHLRFPVYGLESEAFFEAALAVSGDAIHMAVEPEELTPEDFT